MDQEIRWRVCHYLEVSYLACDETLAEGRVAQQGFQRGVPIIPDALSGNGCRCHYNSVQ